MEKDLRDAYKALSLLRADLTATRQAKSALEDQWLAFVAKQRAQDAQRGAQLAQIRETFLMREEDFHAQLLHANAAHSEQQQQAIVKNAMLLQELTQTQEKYAKQENQKSEKGGKIPQPEEEDNQQLHEQKTPSQDAQDAQDAQEQAESIMTEKVELLASVFALKQQVQDQADQLIKQDVAITQERNEWGLQREEMTREITVLQEAKRDFEREKKFSDEKFEFLRTEVDVVKAERDALTSQVQVLVEKPVDAVETESSAQEEAVEVEANQTQQELYEMQVTEAREAHAAELAEHQRRVEELGRETEDQRRTLKELTRELEEQTVVEASRREEMEERHKEEMKTLKMQLADEKQTLEDQFVTLKEQLKQQTERTKALEGGLKDDDEAKGQEILELMRERTDLLQQLEAVRAEATEQLRSHAKEEEERMKTQLSEREKLQQELMTLLSSFEDATAENAVKMNSLQTTNETLLRGLSEKSRALAETQGRVQSVQQQLSHMHQVVVVQREGLERCREDAKEQRGAMIIQQQEFKLSVQRLEEELLTKFGVEKEGLEQQSQAERSALERDLVACEVARAGLEDELRASADASQALKQQLHAAEAARAFLEQQVETSGARISELELELEAKDEELAGLRSLTTTEHEVRGQEIDTLRTLHHKATTERNALVEEVHKLKLEYGRLEAEVIEGQTSVNELRKLQDLNQHLEGQVRGLEQQLMAIEDHAEDPHHAGAAVSSSSWSELASQIQSLDDFLPQLQLFAGRLQTCFLLCAENPRAMRILSTTSSPSLLSDLMTLHQLVGTWRRLFEVKGLALHVRLVRRTVLATLSQWFEEGEENSEISSPPPPPPPFDIESQEVAIILQNWTVDLEKRQSVAEWLKRIATATSSDSDSDSPRDESAGTTLELKDMTREVKDAFCMLIVPLLKQNRHAFVRVFTRRVCDVKSSYSPDETSWQMRIHVQFPHHQRRMETPTRLHRVSSSSSISSVASSLSVSSVASSLSLSSISSASKLQIIQARLQQMQQQHN